MKKNSFLILSVFSFLFIGLIGCEDNATPTTPSTTEYTVTFDDNEGKLTSPLMVKVQSGEKVTKPTDPTRTDYTFVEWRKTDATTAFNFATETITADITLTAQWVLATIPTFTVTFAGEGVTTLPQTVADGSMANEPPTPTREGFSFLGWQDTDSKVFDFNTAISADITLTADWKSAGAVSNVVIELDTTALTTEYRLASYVYTDGDGTVVPNSPAEVKWLVSDNSDGTSATAISTEATYSPVGVNRYKFVSASVRVKATENGYTPEEKSTTSLFPGFSTKATGSTNKFTSRYDAGTVNFNGKMWIIGGYSVIYLNTVYSSSDGATWENQRLQTVFADRSSHTVLSFNNKMWIIGGVNDTRIFNDVHSSTDGVNWTRVVENAAFSGRQGHASVVHNNKMWVIGGTDGSDTGRLADVWSSENGVTWARSTADAGFSARADHTLISHGGKMWVIGGTSGSNTGKLDDVWSSSDGVTWTQSVIPFGSGFPARSGHTSIAHDGKMWIIGGEGIKNTQLIHLDDIWWSPDGANWKPALEHAGFSGRSGHTSIVFNDKIFVLGGRTSSSRFDDVWY